MKTYELQATLGKEIRGATFSAYSDDEAVMEAINIIMDEAFKNKKGPWALGAISLTTVDGEVLQTMEAKV